MSIFSCIDSQSLMLTRKLLENHAPQLCEALPQQSLSRYPLDEITIELELDTIKGIINKLTQLGNHWLDDSSSNSHNERKIIIAYLLKNWIKIGEDANQLVDSQTNVLH